MKKIYFIRHGQSEGNVLKIHQTINTPLSKLGQRQATLVAARFTQIRDALIVTSPCLRAYQTARAIALQNHAEIKINQLFTEKSAPSELTGIAEESQQSKDIKNLHHQHFLKKNGNWRYSDEETAIQFVKRTHQALVFLSQQAEENLIVVSHSLLIKMILSQILEPEANLKSLYEIQQNFYVNNTGLSIAIFDDEKQKWQISCINDCSHLD